MALPGFIQKVECQIQEHERKFFGAKTRTFPARHPDILFTILSTERFHLVKQSRVYMPTDVGAVKNVNNVYYRKIGAPIY